MSWVFFAAALAGALFTLNALRPPHRFWLVQGPAFFASWLTSELAPHHLLWQAAATAGFLYAGALVGWQGRAALGLVALSWVGLAWLHVESRRARGAMEGALREALGDDYRATIEANFAVALDEPMRLRQRVMPLPVRDGRVERIRDLPFFEANGRTMKLDVYRSRERPPRCPVLLQIHGGAWMIGRKEEQALPLMTRLAAHGWVCIAASYRLSPGATFPEHLIDVKAAIRWIREHGAEYGADPDFIVISGGSAGGHLSALAALTPNDPEYQPGFEDADTRVQGCVPFYGVYDFTDRRSHWGKSLLLPMLERYVFKVLRKDAGDAFDRASPMSRVNADAPPFFVIHGSRDTLVPAQDARIFVELLRAVSKEPVAYAELPGAQHAFEVFPSERTMHAVHGVERFLTWAYSRHLRTVALADEDKDRSEQKLVG
ncbi:MAG: alpha/beta hydrolase fold domain-containing protein [Byssovorax sp.]